MENNKNISEKPSNKEQPVEKRVEDAFDFLKKDYILVGKTHIRAWKGWLALGLTAGIASGVILVANRSGQVEGGKAANEEVYSEEYASQPLTIQTKETDTTKKARDLSLVILRLANKIKQESGAARLLDVGVLSQKLTERKGLIATVLKEDPFTAFTLLFPSSVLAGLPTEVKGIAEEALTTEGKIEIIHFDDFKDHAKSLFQYFLRTTDGKRRRFYPVGGEPSLLSGSTIWMKGHKIGEDLIAPMGKDSFEVVAAQTPDAIGDQKTLVVLMTFLDSSSPPFSPEEAKKLVFDDQMQAFYKEASYGKVSWSGDVLGWFTTQRNGVVDGRCIWPRILNSDSPEDDVYKFIKHSVDLHHYSRLVIMAHHPCMESAFSMVGKISVPLDGETYDLSLSWIGDIKDFSVPYGSHPFHWTWLDLALSHELGHQLGAAHANSWSCGAGQVLYGTCVHKEYGNNFDVMGTGGADVFKSGSASYGLHFNAFYKDLFGWLPDSTLTVTQTGTYTLSPLESSSGMRIAKIKPPFLSNTPYYLEYRRAIGFDRALQNNPSSEINQHGILVNWIPQLPEDNLGFSRLLDMSPAVSAESPDDVKDWISSALLKRGYVTDGIAKTAFYDTGRGIGIGPVWSANDDQSTFSVAIVPPRCVRNNPNIVLPAYYPPYRVTAAAGDTSILYFELRNLDSLSCSSSRFQMTSRVPLGWESVFAAPDPILLTPNESLYISMQINIHSKTPPGEYTVTIRTINLDTWKVTDTVITYTITP